MGTIANGGSVTVENPDFYTWINMAEGRIDEIKIFCLFKDPNNGKLGKLTIIVEEIILNQEEEYNWSLIGFIEIKNKPIPISITYSEKKKEAWYSITPENKGGDNSNFEQTKKATDNFFGDDFFGKDWPFRK